MQPIRRRETARLILRPFDDGDFESFAGLRADGEVMRFIGRGVRSRLESELAFRRMHERWVKDGFGLWALEERGAVGLVGRCGLKPLARGDGVELGYLLATHAWGRGLATEAAREALHVAIEVLGAPQVVAFSHPDNAASLRVMHKLGLQVRGMERHHDVDCVAASITPGAYRKWRDAAGSSGARA